MAWARLTWRQRPALTPTGSREMFRAARYSGLTGEHNPASAASLSCLCIRPRDGGGRFVFGSGLPVSVQEAELGLGPSLGAGAGGSVFRGTRQPQGGYQVISQYLNQCYKSEIIIIDKIWKLNLHNSLNLLSKCFFFFSSFPRNPKIFT